MFYPSVRVTLFPILLTLILFFFTLIISAAYMYIQHLYMTINWNIENYFYNSLIASFKSMSTCVCCLSVSHILNQYQPIYLLFILHDNRICPFPNVAVSYLCLQYSRTSFSVPYSTGWLYTFYGHILFIINMTNEDI